MTKHFVFADTMAEAESIIEYLEDWCDNYSGSISHHNLLVAWLDCELTERDWNKIYKLTLAKLEGTPEYDELLEQGCL